MLGLLGVGFVHLYRSVSVGFRRVAMWLAAYCLFQIGHLSGKQTGWL